jgi:hypothetical protein
MALVFGNSPRALALLLGAAAALIFLSPSFSNAAPAVEPRVYLPLVFEPIAALSAVPPASLPTDWLSRVNHYRALAGVPPLSDDLLLSAACSEYSGALAAESARVPVPAGMQPCAENSLEWSSAGTGQTPLAALEHWMRSPEQRQWLLYPTTRAFGFGFNAQNQRGTAVLDVRSAADFASDTAYAGWPVRYPGADQIGVEPGQSPVTLLWRRNGPAPQITATSLATTAGDLIAHDVMPLPAGHQGIQLVPQADLPAATLFTIEVHGVYQGTLFSERWQFTTGNHIYPDAAQPAPHAPLPPASLPSAP